MAHEDKPIVTTNQDNTATRFCALFGTLESDRSGIENVWRDISLLVQPTRSTERFLTRGQDRSQSTFDNTAGVASTRLASLLSGSLTSLEWFILKPKDQSVNSREVNLWLDFAQEVLFSIFRSPGSGFNSAINEAYLDLSAIGTCSVFTSGEDLIQFNALPMREVFVAHNQFGRIDTMFRRKQWTADQAAEFFGLKNLTEGAQEDYQSTRRYTNTREYLHVVMPREDIEQDKELSINNNHRFASIYLDKKEKKIIRVGGFDTFPYAVARWKVGSGEIYGTSPAIEVIDEIRYVNALKRALVVAVTKAADPPLVVENESVIGKLRANPSGITYLEPGKEIKQLPIGDPSFALEDLAQTREAIKVAFFNDIAQLPLQDRMTAREVIERRNDQMQMMAPFVSRIQEELLGPIIARTLVLAVQKGAIDPPPQELNAVGLSVEYVSPLAISQKTSRVQAVQIWLNSMTPFAQLSEEAAIEISSAIEVSAIPEYLAESLNIPTFLRKAPEQIAQEKAAKAQQAEVQQLLGAGQQVAETAKTAAEATAVAGRIGA